MDGRRRRYRAEPRLWQFLLLLTLVSLCVAFICTAKRLTALDARADEKNAELSALLTEKSEKQNELDYAMTDEYVERAARDKLGFIYENEIRYVHE